MALTELEYELDGTTFSIKKLPLGKSQEALVRLLHLLGSADGLSENMLATLPSKLKVDDINFFRNALFGEHCAKQNEAGNWVPMGKALVEQHFAGHLGSMLHLLGKCIMWNFSDFLADLRLDELVGANEAE